MRTRTVARIALLLLLLPPALEAAEHERVSTGYASWYGGHFQGRLTANGETFDTNELTAAHRTLPFNSIVRVTYLENDRSVVVRINDRGPFVDNRIIDLSRAAADAIGLTTDGVGLVRLEILHLQEDTRLRSIQVGSYSVGANASRVAESLREGGLSPVIQHAAPQGVYRVLIQGVAVHEVEQYKSELRRLGYPNVLVRIK